MNDKRGPWFILTGLVLGVGLGIGLAWGLPQAEPINTSPASLRADFKDEYRYMIAAAYTITGDLGRAQARLSTLSEANSITALGEQAQRMLAQNSSMEKIRILANLSEALQAQPTPTPASERGTDGPLPVTPLNANSPTPELTNATPFPTETPAPDVAAAIPTPTENPSLVEPVETQTPLPSATLRPTRTATPTPGAPFTLENQSTFCEPAKAGLLQIYLQNASGQPVPGIELVLTWFGGEEHFFTGFKNEISPGYADYVLTSEIEYALSLSGGSTRLSGLIAPVCTGDDGKSYPGTILLEFRQP